jgi:hypothetical protein
MEAVTRYLPQCATSGWPLTCVTVSLKRLCWSPPVLLWGLQPCGEYLFDFRALNVSINGQTLLDWYVHSWAMNANSANGSNPYVDGTFFDGTQSVPWGTLVRVLREMLQRTPCVWGSVIGISLRAWRQTCACA